jgi:hypothetical protein
LKNNKTNFGNENGFCLEYLLVALMVVSCSALPQLDRNMGNPGEAPLPTPVGTCPEYSYNTVFLSDAFYCGYMYRENKLYIQLFVFITIKRNF